MKTTVKFAEIMEQLTGIALGTIIEADEKKFEVTAICTEGVEAKITLACEGEEDKVLTFQDIVESEDYIVEKKVKEEDDEEDKKDDDDDDDEDKKEVDEGELPPALKAAIAKKKAKDGDKKDDDDDDDDDDKKKDKKVDEETDDDDDDDDDDESKKKVDECPLGKKKGQGKRKMDGTGK